ncbi:hypothetical protein niasHT_030616 [Heterodera trifolii]|uniref:AF4/FMR2 C-terminal homology domain-containing protein n=1 Tax=Heterodera trifolii TaxID=157864 RepID=A0ABD2ISY9_9BILA
MKNDWDPLKTKSDIKQRLNRLFGRFDQYSEFAAKPRTPDHALTEHVTTPVTNIPPVNEEQNGEKLRERREIEGGAIQRQNNDPPENESRDHLEHIIGQLVNVSKPLSPVRFVSEKATTSSAEADASNGTHSEEQPECSAARLNSDIEILLQHITFVEPFISPIRSEDNLPRKKRPLSATSHFDDAPAPKRQTMQANEPDRNTTRTEQKQTNGKGPQNVIKLRLAKQNFRLLQQNREQDKKADQRDNMDSSTSSGMSESANTPRAPSSNLAEEPTQHSDGKLSSGQSAVATFAPRFENGKNLSVDHFASRARELKKSGNNERDKVHQILLYFESVAFYIMTASSLNSKPEKMHSSLTDVVNFLNSSWASFKNSKSLSSSSAAISIRNRLKTIQLMISSCLAFHLYSIHSTRVMTTHFTLQRYEKENPQKRPATALDGASGNSVGTTASSPAASTPNSNRSNNSQQSLISLPVDIYANMSQQLRTLNHLMWSHKLWSDAKISENKALDDGLTKLCGQLKHDAELAEVAQFLLDVTAWLRKEYARLQSDAKMDTPTVH